MKKCSKCGVEKDESVFSKCSAKKDGLSPHCKICASENNKKWAKDNIKHKSEYQKEYQKNNAEQIAEYQKEYQKNNSEQIAEYQKEYYIKNVKDINEYHKKYNKDNAEKIASQQKKYQKEYYEQIAKYKKEYYEKNKKQINEYINEYYKQRREVDPLFKLTTGIRCLIGICFRNQGFKKNTKTSAILGCTYEEFQLHIEKQFTDGMTWANQGLWHLDHIYPVSRAVDEQHLLQLNHYTNFQPLWAEENLKKGNKIFDNPS